MATELHGDHFKIQTAMKGAVQIEIRMAYALRHNDCFNSWDGEQLPGVWIYVLDGHGIWRTNNKLAPNSLYQWELAKIIHDLPEAEIKYAYNPPLCP